MITIHSFIPDPVPGELLSSFLVRAALRYGMNAYRFTAYQIPNVQLWTRDIDRSVSDKTIGIISKIFHLDNSQVANMTLRRYERSYAIFDADAHGCRQGIAAWINAAGIYHSMRYRHGLQYCPDCLREIPIYRQHWRLSFVTVCPVHRRFLCDCCPHCGAAVVPHLNHISHLRCYHCHTLLNQCSAILPSSSEFNLLCAMQANYLRTVDGESTLCDKRNTLEKLRGLHFLMLALRRHRHASHPRCDNMLSTVGRGPIEVSCIAERVQALLFYNHLLKNWPVNFRKLAESSRLCQKAFLPLKNLPLWLEREVELLPERAIASVRCRRAASISHDSMDNHRRSLHATIITNLAEYK